MKAVQIGILAALLLCAGLLVTVYRNQQAPDQTTAKSAAQPVQTPAAQPVAATPQTPAAEPVAPAAAEPAKEAPKKPSPVVRSSKHEDRQMTHVRTTDTSYTPPPAPATPAPQAPAAPAPAPEHARTAAQESTPAIPAPMQPAQMPPPPPREPQRVTVPAGATITVRLAETINSNQRHSGDTFTATLDQPLIVDGFAIAERGAKVTGSIVESQEAGRVRGVSAITLQLTKLHTSDGQDVTISTEKFAKQGEKSTGDDAKKIGVGAALGAAIGAIAGGGKGAAIGAGVGGAAGTGTVMATRGKPVELPVETRLTFKLAEPVTLTEKTR